MRWREIALPRFHHITTLCNRCFLWGLTSSVIGLCLIAGLPIYVPLGFQLFWEEIIPWEISDGKLLARCQEFGFLGGGKLLQL